MDIPLIPMFFGEAPATAVSPHAQTGQAEATPVRPATASEQRDSQSCEGQRPQKKRVITAARKEQNRQAQKLFRQRQKQRRQHQKEKPVEAGQRRELRPRSITKDGGMQEEIFSSQSPDSAGSSGQGCFDIDFLSANQVDAFFRESERPMSSTSSSSSRLYTHSPSPIDGSEPPTPFFDGSDHTTPTNIVLADPKINTIEFLPTAIFGALLQNGVALGFDLLQLSSCGPDGISPFYRPAVAQDHPSGLISMAIADLPQKPPEHLCPTLNQIVIPHHPSLDLIPLPHLRDRAIALSAAMPQVFNLWEMKLDTYTRGGLGVQKCKVDRQGRVKEFQPWERSSWKAAPWFLQKWSMVVDQERKSLTVNED